MTQETPRTARIKWLLVALHLGSLLPLILFGWAALRGQLGFNPVETALRQSGRAAVALLLLSLAVTPLRKVFNLPWLHKLRKPLGLYAALYAGLHFAAFAVWDYGLNLRLIWFEIVSKPFLLLGLAALLILLVLAVSSIRAWRVKLRAGWRNLHKTVYLAAGLAIAHYLLAVKGDLLTLQGEYNLPLAASGVLLVLFLLRLPFIQRPLGRWVNRKPDQ
jgi:methionine sulfoxide reductase heme-binding subunit